MFTLEELLSKKNQLAAFAYLEKKKDGCGKDGMKLSELKGYWELNSERICKEIGEGNYVPGVIETYEILKASGKKRTLSKLNSIDRFITRLLEQKLTRYIEPIFCENSFAYQEGKGLLCAVTKAKEYIEQGNRYVIEIDIKDYFDNIPLEELEKMIVEKITDDRVLTLIRSYLYCKISQDGIITIKKKGLVQGCSISPILSNLFLHELDTYMHQEKLSWFRYADNIFIYAKENTESMQIYETICGKLIHDFGLKINEKRSGIFDVFAKKILGYEFCEKAGLIEIRKAKFQEDQVTRNWGRCAVQKVNQEYHIIQDGIITKKDYALLFENEEKKHHIPVEVVDQINFYSNVTISSQVLQTLNEKNIKASFFDKHGNLVGCYTPEKSHGDAKVLLKQCEMYSGEQRLTIGKKMEKAALHNMRANLRYYNKRKDLEDYISILDNCIADIEECAAVEELLLVEARARGKYYEAFNLMIESDDFRFTTRTKRPPEDELNALISFGNTLLYNLFLQFIWKTALDSRIGVIHATGRRNHSLNLDFADIYKPIIVDRVIFTLINCHQIKRTEYFEKQEQGGICLSKEGKRIFIEEFNEKLATKIIIKGKEYTYKKLMQREVTDFLKMLSSGEKYNPYKYY